jgi:hypothetical protein
MMPISFRGKNDDFKGGWFNGSHRRVLRAIAGEPSFSFLYHGTLCSRLLGIARDGLIPAKRRKKWPGVDVTEHAATGVFFERDWRRAANWVGTAAYNEDLLPTKGAVVRVPSQGLSFEDDVRSAGALVVRQDRIPIDQAEVMLFPFTVNGEWMPLSTAVDAVRRTRKSGFPRGG